MNIVIGIAIIFYLTLVGGAILRFRKSGSIASKMQLIGTLLPLVPSIFIPFLGATETILTAYAALWLIMGFGYLIEGIQRKAA